MNLLANQGNSHSSDTHTHTNPLGSYFISLLTINGFNEIYNKNMFWKLQFPDNGFYQTITIVISIQHTGNKRPVVVNKYVPRFILICPRWWAWQWRRRHWEDPLFDWENKAYHCKNLRENVILNFWVLYLGSMTTVCYRDLNIRSRYKLLGCEYVIYVCILNYCTSIVELHAPVRNSRLFTLWHGWLVWNCVIKFCTEKLAFSRAIAGWT